MLVATAGAVTRRRFLVLTGLNTRGNTSIFVSLGIEMVYVLVRINCPSEVAIVTLKWHSRI